MTKEELLYKLAQAATDHDKENAHFDADLALLEYINDPDISAAYGRVEKWYV